LPRGVETDLGQIDADADAGHDPALAPHRHGKPDDVLAIPREIAYDVLVAAEQVVNKEVEIKDWVQSGVRPTAVVARGGCFRRFSFNHA
jgi:hypothetical protein